ncbi:MAG: FAD-dependent oxidoreductase [Chloroflexi bacterium]|nr:FAD-dependent oxidoreductase [Chloroflexota bacterium]
MVSFPKLFSPIKIGGVQIANRVVMLPMGTAYATAIGEVTRKTIDHYVERARGGVGLIIVGNVSPFGRIGLNQLILDADWYMSGHYELVEAVHAEGTPICAQLNHPGRQIYPWVLDPGKDVISASDIQTSFLGEVTYPKPRPATIQEIYEIMDRWAEAAARAKKVGYDMVELHGAHGYLIQQFMSPYTNKRTDEFGGSFENRMRFPLELIKRVRKAVGESYPIGMRFPSEEFLGPEGITLKDSPAIAREMEKAGVAYLSVSCGTFQSADKFNDIMRQPEGWKHYLWETIKKSVAIPIIAGGGIKHPDFAEKMLALGKADFIGLARPLLADPHWARKAHEGRTEDIRLCISCIECIHGSTKRRQGGGARRCNVNSETGREGEFIPIKPAAVKKKVMIVGGGPGGMEAARVGALRGHDVTLYEKGKELGGALLLAGVPPGKEKINWVSDFLKTQIAKAGVKVKLGTEVTPELIQKERPDVVIVATGSRPIFPPALAGKNVFTALDVLSGKAEISDKKVLVVGGGMVGCETAEYLVHHDNKVTVIKRTPRFAPDMEIHNRYALLQALNQAGVVLRAGRAATEAVDGGIMALDTESGKEVKMDADVVVIALGATPNRDLADALEDKVPELYTIGDCNEPRIIMEAVYEGARVGRRI